MIRLMREVQQGNLEVHINVRYGDEIGNLSRHFNRMISRIKELIEEITFTQMRKKEAELRALHSQINPHFIRCLFNRVKTPTSTSGIFKSGGVESPSDSSMFSLAERVHLQYTGNDPHDCRDQ